MTTNLSNKISSNIFLDNFLKNIPIVKKTSEELLRVESIELLSQASFTCLINYVSTQDCEGLSEAEKAT